MTSKSKRERKFQKTFLGGTLRKMTVGLTEWSGFMKRINFSKERKSYRDIQVRYTF
jgi:hypothetical protein